MENLSNNITHSQIILTPKEVANYLCKSLSWVYKNQIELGGSKLGGSLFFPRKEDLYERIFRKEKGVEVRLHLEGNQVHQRLVPKKAASTKSGNGKERRNKESGASDQGANNPNRHGILGFG